MKPRVLLVDDETLILLGWEHSLRSAGYDVETALNGKEALEIVNEKKPDIVITDYVMPEMNGVELCRKIKKISPETEVVLLSGLPKDTSDYQTNFINAGGKDIFLNKPLATREIIRSLEKIMKDKI